MNMRIRYNTPLALVIVLGVLSSGCAQTTSVTGAIDFGYSGTVQKSASYSLNWRGKEQAIVRVAAAAPKPPPTEAHQVVYMDYTSWTLSWEVESSGRALQFLQPPARATQLPRESPETWTILYDWQLKLEGEGDLSFSLIVTRTRDQKLRVKALVDRDILASPRRSPGLSTTTVASSGIQSMELHLDNAQDESVEATIELGAILQRNSAR